MPILSSVGNLTSSYEQLSALRNPVLIRGPKEILFQLERWSYMGWYRLYNVSASVTGVLRKSFCLSLFPVVQRNTWPLDYSSVKLPLHHIPQLAQNLWVSDAYSNLSTVWTIPSAQPPLPPHRAMDPVLQFSYSVPCFLYPLRMSLSPYLCPCHFPVGKTFSSPPCEVPVWPCLKAPSMNSFQMIQIWVFSVSSKNSNIYFQCYPSSLWQKPPWPAIRSISASANAIYWASATFWVLCEGQILDY